MGRRKEFNEEVLQDKAMSLFWQNGFHKTTLACLARETGIKRGSLYNAYTNKENIFLEAFKKQTENYLEECKQSLAKPSLKSALKTFFRVAIQLMQEGKPAHGCLTTRIIVEATDDMTEIKTSIIAYLDAVELELRNRFILAVEQGQFHGDPDRSAKLVIAVVRGMAVMERAYSDEKRLRDIADETLNLLLNMS